MKMRTRAVVGAGLVLVLAPGLTGCASSAGGGGGGGGDGGWRGAAAEPAETHAEGAVGQVLQPSVLLRDVPADSVLINAKGSRQTVVREPAPDGVRWVVRRSGATGADALEQRFVLLDDGSAGLEEQVDRGEGVEVVFTPPLVVLFGGMGVGERREQTLRMVVHPIGDRSRVKAKGPVLQSLVFEGWEEVGGVLAAKVTGRFEADLSPAKVLEESTQWFGVGRGLLREIRRERTKVLGVTIRDNAEEWSSAEVR